MKKNKSMNVSFMLCVLLFRYCLPNPNQMVELWMRVLSSVWSENCPAVAYLMDKILSTALNNDHLKHMINSILSTLIEVIEILYLF